MATVWLVGEVVASGAAPPALNAENASGLGTALTLQGISLSMDRKEADAHREVNNGVPYSLLLLRAIAD